MTDLSPRDIAAEAARAAEFVAFRAGGLEFCINIMSVREIRGWTPATAIPRAPGYIRGVINLRGVVLPIVDLGVRLGLPGTEPTARHVIIVAQVGDKAAGLLVDSVSDILSVDDSTIQPTPDVASGLARLFVRGVIAMDGRMISVITVDNVLPAGGELEAA
ncbi:MAG: chemotaxis protein CheW [Hyphomicrobiales bacterium]